MNSEIKAIIVEDMADYLSTIEMLLAEVAPWVKIVGKAVSLQEAEMLIEEVSPDLVLLDIQFENEGRTGFELLDSLKSRNRLNFQLIIVTAHFERQYYAKAFEYKAIHFLEKPVNKYKLAEAVGRVKESLVEFRIGELANKIGSEIGIIKPDSRLSRITIEGLRYTEVIEIKDIVWIEADGRMSYIYLQNERKIVSLSNIGIHEKQLQDFPQFFRINRSEIINISFVERYSKKEKLIVLKGKHSNHFVSKEKFTEFLTKLGIQSVL